MVDGASVEGRDPVEDIKSICREIEAYDPSILERPQVIAANKMDACMEGSEEILAALREAFGSKGIEVFGISAVSGQGVKEPALPYSASALPVSLGAGGL